MQVRRLISSSPERCRSVLSLGVSFKRKSVDAKGQKDVSENGQNYSGGGNATTS